LGRRFAAVFGFERDEDARKAVGLLKKAAGPVRRRPIRRR
jgi:hypothetical protein